MTNTKTNSAYSQSRLEAFSDGIFAIAITLLVLNIQLPENAAHIPIKDVLIESLPKLEIWLISFFIIGGMWVRHHKLVRVIKDIDSFFLKLNLLYLMFITLIPWLVSLIVAYGEQPLAVAVFSGGIALIGIISGVMWGYLAYLKNAIDKSMSEYEKNFIMLSILTYIAIACTSIIVAYTISYSLALYWFFLNAFTEKFVRLIYKPR